MEQDNTHPEGIPGTRVAVVLTQLGYGGAERQTVELLRCLRGGKWAPHMVVCLSSIVEPYGPVLENLGYPVHVLPRTSSFDVARLVRLRRILAREEIGLVHAVHELASGYSWIACRLGRRIPMLPTYRTTKPSRQPGTVRSIVYRTMLRDCSRTLANSQRGAEFLHASLGAPQSRLVVVPNGLDFDELRRSAGARSLRKSLGLGGDCPVIGYVGKDSPKKNVPRFIEVARRLLSRIPDLHVVLAGPGLDASAHDRLGTTGNADRIHYLGPRSDIPAILGELDLLVLTSDSEGCPNVVLEALGVGTPVVAARVGDIEAMVPGGAGRVVARDDIPSYVAAAIEILANRSQARNAVRESWPILEQKFAMDQMVGRTVQIWEEILEQSG